MTTAFVSNMSMENNHHHHHHPGAPPPPPPTSINLESRGFRPLFAGGPTTPGASVNGPSSTTAQGSGGLPPPPPHQSSFFPPPPSSQHLPSSSQQHLPHHHHHQQQQQPQQHSNSISMSRRSSDESVRHSVRLTSLPIDASMRDLSLIMALANEPVTIERIDASTAVFTCERFETASRIANALNLRDDLYQGVVLHTAYLGGSVPPMSSTSPTSQSMPMVGQQQQQPPPMGSRQASRFFGASNQDLQQQQQQQPQPQTSQTVAPSQYENGFTESFRSPTSPSTLYNPVGIEERGKKLIQDDDSALNDISGYMHQSLMDVTGPGFQLPHQQRQQQQQQPQQIGPIGPLSHHQSSTSPPLHHPLSHPSSNPASQASASVPASTTTSPPQQSIAPTQQQQQQQAPPTAAAVVAAAAAAAQGSSNDWERRRPAALTSQPPSSSSPSALQQQQQQHSSQSTSPTNSSSSASQQANGQRYTNQQQQQQQQQQGDLVVQYNPSNTAVNKQVMASGGRVMPPANPADQNPPCNTLYVGNLPADTQEQELKELFEQQPGYKRLCFRTKANGPMCFVEFASTQYATVALGELYGVGLSNSVKGGIRLSYSKNPLGVRSNNGATVNNGERRDVQQQQQQQQQTTTTPNGTTNGMTTAQRIAQPIGQVTTGLKPRNNSAGGLVSPPPGASSSSSGNGTMNGRY